MNAVQVFDAVMNPKVIVLAFLSSVACASPDDTDEGRQSGTVGDSGTGAADVDVPGTSGDASVVVEDAGVGDVTTDRMLLTPEDPCGDVEGEGPIYPEEPDAGLEGGVWFPDFTLMRNAYGCLNRAQEQRCGWSATGQINMCSDVTFEEVETCAAAVLSQDPQTYCPDGYRAPLQDEACLPLFQRDDCDLDPLGRPPTCDLAQCPEAPGTCKNVNRPCCAETRCGLLMPHGPGNGLLCTPIEETDYSNWIDAGTDWWKDGGGG